MLIKTLLVKLGLDADDYHKGLTDAKETTGSAVSAIVSGLSSVGGAVVMGALGLAASAIIGIGVAAWTSANELDSAFDTIAIRTGATGEVLTGLQDDFRDVFTSIPTDAETAANVIGTLNTRLGLTGEELQNVATPLLEMTRLLGGDATTNTALFTRVMGDWSISSEEAAETLDVLFAATQATGVSVDGLMAKVVQFGSPLRLMGFTLEESIALFSKWEQEGVNAELVMGSLRIAAGHFADSMDSGVKVLSGGVPDIEAARVQLLELQVALEKAEEKQARLNETGSAAEQALNAIAVEEYRNQINDLTAAMEKGEFVYDTSAESQASLRDRLLETFDAIKNTTDASEALALGMDVFGARAGPDMVAAIREGRFEISDLLAVLGDSEGAILDTAAATADWGERLTVLKNKASVALEPLGTWLMDAASAALDFLSPAFEQILLVATVVLTAVANVAQGLVDVFILGKEPLGDWSVLWENLAVIVGPNLAQTLTNLVVLIQENLPKAFEAFQSGWAWLMENEGVIVGILVALGVAVAAFVYTTVIPAAVAMIAALAPIVLPLLAIIAIVALLYEAWQNNWGGIRDTLTAWWTDTGQPIFDQLKSWLEINIPVAIAVLKAFWLTELLPALLDVWSWIQGTLFPLLSDLGVWLQTNIPVAIAVLKAFWLTELLPAIIAVREWIVTTLVPMLTDLQTWLQTTIPAAIATLKTFWTETLLPAIKGVWTFIQEDLMPLFQALVDFWGAAFTLALTALAGLWENVLQPAFKAVGDYVLIELGPILLGLSDFWTNTFSPALTTVKTSVLDVLPGVFQAIRDAIGWVTGKLGELTTMLNGITLPWWLTPGSPTPFEYGLLGINRALEDLNRRELPRLAANLQLRPVLVGAPAGVGTGLSSTRINQLTAHYAEREDAGSVGHTLRLMDTLDEP